MIWCCKSNYTRPRKPCSVFHHQELPSPRRHEGFAAQDTKGLLHDDRHGMTTPPAHLDLQHRATEEPAATATGIVVLLQRNGPAQEARIAADSQIACVILLPAQTIGNFLPCRREEKQRSRRPSDACVTFGG